MHKETIHQFTLTIDRNTSLEHNVNPSKHKIHCALLVQLVDNVDADETKNQSVPGMALKSAQKLLVTLLEAASLSYIPGSILMQCKIKVWDSAFGQYHQSHKTTKLSERHTSL